MDKSDAEEMHRLIFDAPIAEFAKSQGMVFRKLSRSTKLLGPLLYFFGRIATVSATLLLYA